MSKYAVTGATGQLGRLIIAQLLESGVSPDQIVAIARTPDKAADIAARGVSVRAGDYTKPAELASALEGIEVLMFVSGSEAGQRLPQHRAVIDAAATAGVSRIVYTSLLRADTSPNQLAPEHRATEELLVASGIPYTILRNGWYVENYTGHLADDVRAGEIVTAAGDGRVAAAARADYAAAAVAVLTGTGHDNTVYELGGPAFTMDEFAAAITAASGTTVVHRRVTIGELVERLVGAGLPAGTAAFVAGLDEGAARGDLDTDSLDLVDLIGRPTTPMAQVVAVALAASS